jgi:hypothetical protein
VQEAQGRVPDAKHWRAHRVAPTDDVPVRVGTVVDVSGSMSMLAEPLALISYAVGRGVEGAGGHYASVAMGYKATGIVGAGKRMDAVPTVDPDDPSENIRDAMLSLDAELDLVDGDGLRVLILASDGCFVRTQQREWADKHIPLWVKKGVIVLHLDLEGGEVEYWDKTRYNARHNNPLPPLVFKRGEDPLVVMNRVGDEIIRYAREFSERAA